MDCQKHLFSLPEGHHYLNCAYLSPMSTVVEETGKKGIIEKRTPWTITPEGFFKNSDRLRSLFADLVNIPDPERVAILPSVSYGLATVAKNLPETSGKNIIVSGEQFPSNVYSWKRFCRENRCDLRTVKAPKTGSGRGKLWNERILEAIDSDTLLVALGNIHWTDGTLFDLKTIGKRAREMDAWFVIDGTQSVGALPFDVQEIRPDVLVCAGYKWLMGPYSMALGYFGPRFNDGIPLEEGWIARKNSEDFAGLVNYGEEYQPGAIRYDVGERSNFILVPMMIKALEQILEWGPSTIQTYCRNLISGLPEKLSPSGYQLGEEKWRASHLFGIRLPEHIQTTILQKKLTERNVHVSVRGNAVRVSPNVYNNQEDIRALVEALE